MLAKISPNRPLSPSHLTSLLLPSKPLTITSSTPAALATAPGDIADLILQQKTPSAALQTFRWVSSLPSFRPHPTICAALVRSLLSFRRPFSALRFLSSLPSSAPIPDEPTLVSLVRALGRAGRPRDAVKVLDLIDAHDPSPRILNARNPSLETLNAHNPSLRILNAILNVLVKDDIDLARGFFRRRMAGQGNEFTFGILMKGLCRTNRIDEGFKLLKLYKGGRFGPNPVIYNTLIHALCRNGKVGRARSLMAEMESPSDVTFNILVSAYCGEGNLVQALVMLEKSLDFGFVPDAIAVTKIVDLLCSHGRAMEAVEVLERVETNGGGVDAVVYNTLIKGFCRMEKPQVGRRVLKEMERKGILPNVRTYNALITGFCDSEKLDSALELFEEMRIDGISPNFETFDALIQGLCSGGRVEDGLKVLGMMEEQRGGHGDRISPYNGVLYGLYKEDRLEEAYEFLNRMASFFPRAVDRTLRIKGYCEEGKVNEAKLVYNKMVGEGGVPSALVYVSLINGLCGEGNVREAFDFMNLMVEKGRFPVASTFNALIRGFCDEGRSVSASKLLEEMVRRGCSPITDSYSPLIGAFCKQGDLEKAIDFLEQMVERDLVPDHCTWNSLLMSEILWTGSKTVDHINEVMSSCAVD